MPERRKAQAPAESAVASPCVRNCCLDENDICMGCFRSLDEITGWGQAADSQRHEILERARRRKEQRNHSDG